MSASSQDQSLPPMLLQYREYKSRYQDCLLFFQVGDFYEMFFEDARTAARALNLTLTTRDKNNPDPVPMAGVPVSAVDGYIERLVDQGYSVAVVSQVGTPTGKAMVDRRLERIVTPGIGVMGSIDSHHVASTVCSVYVEGEIEDRADISLAFSDVQTGVVYVRDNIGARNLLSEMARISPAEIILPQAVGGKRVDRRQMWIKELEKIVRENGLKFRPASYYTSGISGQRSFSEIKGYSGLSPVSRKAVRLLLNYTDEITADVRVSVREILVKDYDEVLTIDAVTRRTLELVANARDGGVSGTLFALMDRCRSVGGSRLLRQWLLNPLTSVERIRARQSAVSFLRKHLEVRRSVSDLLHSVPDIERIAARIELKVVSPRELAALRDSLELAPRMTELLPVQERQLSGIAAALNFPAEVGAVLSGLADNPPASVQEDGMIRAGFDAELDRLREIKQKGRFWISEFEAGERQRTGINSLKVRYNNVLGFYIELTKANASKAPEYFIRRQSTINSERFTTVELKEREAEVLGAESKALEMERSLFFSLRDSLSVHVGELRRVGAAFSRLDVLAALAELAEREDYVQPAVDDSCDLQIKDGRHPVLSSMLRGSFVPNSLQMGDEPDAPQRGLPPLSRPAGGADPQRGVSCYIITGPNMGGKSTFLRQNGLIVLMAQMGSFVPAREARIGVVDRIFARMGASDDLTEGESTFMVEMREVSNIVANSTARSLLLVDEVGRGTATADGLAIARSVLEWIVLRLQCRALFATHFHELTALAQLYPALGNLSVGAVEEGHEVVFTHEIRHGAASKSYGLEVARLAGLPHNLLQRAAELLMAMNGSRGASQRLADSLEVEVSQAVSGSTRQLSMFAADVAGGDPFQIREPEDYQELKALVAGIAGLEIDEMTPLQALNFLGALRKDLKQKLS